MIEFMGGLAVGIVVTLAASFVTDFVLTVKKPDPPNLTPLTDRLTSIAWLLRLQHHEAAPEVRQLAEDLLIAEQQLQGISPKQTTKNLYRVRS